MSILGAVVPEELAPEVFGSGFVVLCEISKRSKCVETIPHEENFLYVIYTKTFARVAAERCRVSFLNVPIVWKPKPNSKNVFWN